MYIKHQDGYYPVSQEDLNQIPRDRWPKVYSSTEPEVKAWLSSQAKAKALATTKSFANDIREKVANSKHYLQAARWTIQLASAQAIKAGSPTPFDVSMMEREARLRGRGESMEQLADKVIANSLVFANVGAAVDGIETATLDAIEAYAGDHTGYADILNAALDTAKAEFLDIFTPLVGAQAAQSLLSQYFQALAASQNS